MSGLSRYSPELRERAERMVNDNRQVVRYIDVRKSRWGDRADLQSAAIRPFDVHRVNPFLELASIRLWAHLISLEAG